MDIPPRAGQPSPAIRLPRKILCSAVIAASFLAAMLAPPPAGASIAANPVRAQLSQAGRRLVFSLRTSAPVTLARLDRLPRASGSSYLCLALSAAGRGGERRLCLGGGTSSRRRVGLESLDAAGEVVDENAIAARVKRPDEDKLVLALLPGDAGLKPHRYRWRVLAGAGECRAEAAGACEESLPRQGSRLFRLRPVRAVGCTGGTAGLDTNGPRERRAVALTFDDGPSDYTTGFLDVLREKRAPGTFFEIGQEMLGRAATMRRILREGSEIGDHTMHHVELPGHAEIAGARDLIESYTHFEPCLFRPPGGAVDPSVISTAGGLGMRTIAWDVDPADWTTPGSAAVYNRIVDAVQPGSIVLMHDGGGDRSGTLAALPQIIDTLRARGYAFETVTQLLGHRILYRPYG